MTLNTLNLINGGISNFPSTLSTSNQISNNYYALSSTATNPSSNNNNLIANPVVNNSLLISSSFSTNAEGYHSQRTLNSKLIEFSKVLGGNSSKLSEKEEESSTQTNHTQETILQKPIDFIDTSSSFNNNSKDVVNMTQISHENNLFSPFEISNLKSSMNLESSEIMNRNSVNFTPKSKEDQNLRKSMNNLGVSKNQSSKISYNPFLVIKSHLDAVREFYLTPDKKTLVSVGEDMLINFWDFKKAVKNSKENFEPYLTLRTHTTPIFTLTGPKNLNNLPHENCENNYNIFTSGMDGVIRSTRIPSINLDKNLATYEEISELCHTPWRAHQDMIWDLNYHPFENLMSSVSSDGTVKIFKGNENQNVDKSYYSYDSRSKNLIRQFTFKNNFYNFIEIPTSSYWWMKNPNCIFVSHIAPYIKLYDIETGKSIYDFSYNVEKNIPFECQQANKIVFGENVNLLITGHEDRQLRFFDPGQNKIIKNMVAHTDSVSALTQGVKEYEFLSGSHDGSLRCWDIRIFKLLFDIPAHRKKYDEGLLSIKTFPNEKLVITSGADGLIKAFQLN
jgi:WD40 repeat protein